MVGLLVAIEGLGTNVLLLGQDRSVLRFYHHEKRQKEFLFSAYVLCFLGMVPPMVLLFAGMPLSETLAGIPIYPHIVLILPVILLLNFNKLYLSVLRVEDRATPYVLLRICFAISKFALVLGVISMWQNSVGYVIGVLIASSLIFLGTSPHLIRRVSFSWDKGTVNRLWSFGWPFMFHVMGGSVLIFADRFMLEFYLDLSAAGIYTLAYTLGSSVVFIFGAMAIYFEPLIYRKAEQNEQAEKLMGYYSAMSILLAALWGISLLVALPFFTDRLWGAEYAPIIEIVPIVLAAHLLMPVYHQGNYRLTLHQKTKVLATGTIVAAGSNVVLNLMLIPVFEMKGAAIATFFSLLVLSGIVFFSSVKSTDAQIKNLKSFPALVATALCTLLLVLIQRDLVSIVIFTSLAVIMSGYLLSTSRRLHTYIKGF